VAVLVETETWAPGGQRVRESTRAAYDASAQLLLGAGWRVLRVPHGTSLASVWPLAGNRAPVLRNPDRVSV